jgi:hypothetical protein
MTLEDSEKVSSGMISGHNFRIGFDESDRFKTSNQENFVTRTPERQPVVIPQPAKNIICKTDEGFYNSSNRDNFVNHGTVANAKTYKKGYHPNTQSNFNVGKLISSQATR